MKAFLSYSSKDAQFVEAVAKELGRQFCIVDKQAFRTAVEFKESIEKHLDSTGIFVLFASKASLLSDWVNVEVDEAWYRKMHGSIARAAVYIIDSSVTLDAIPHWLRRAKIATGNAPRPTARDIKSHVDDVVRTRRQTHFVGRSLKLGEMEEALTPLEGAPPRTFFVYGLPGIGKRTLVRKAIPGILSIRKFVEVRVAEGDTLNDLSLKIADQMEPYNTTEGLKRNADEILNATKQVAAARMLRNLRRIAELGEMPILFDEGGLLDGEGHLHGPIAELLGAVPQNDIIYIGFVSHRRPKNIDPLACPEVYLPALPARETQRLLALLAEEEQLAVAPSDLRELAEYVAGYPPAAYYAIQQVKNYGLALVMSNKHSLVQFRTVPFLQHLASCDLTETQKLVLEFLAVHSPLPLRVLAHAAGKSDAEIDGDLMRMIDLAFVEPTSEGYYRIADPIKDPVIRAFGYPAEEGSRAVASALMQYIRTVPERTPLLGLHSALYAAATLGKDKTLGGEALSLASDLITATQSLYHNRRYAEAIDYGFVAVDQRPESIAARGYLIRALIKQERWEDANAQLRVLEHHAPRKEVLYLKGFCERNRRDYSTAIEFYTEAIDLGWGGVAIRRELALCHFLKKEYDEAAKHVQEALRRHGDNRYVVDLGVKILIRQGDEDEARKALARLEAVDEPMFYNHRLATLEIAFGHPAEALAAANEAVALCVGRPPFEILAHAAYCQIKTSELDRAAQTLGEIERHYSRGRNDIRTALRCHLLNAKGNYRSALTESERMESKNGVYYKRIRRDAIDGVLSADALDDAEREALAIELDALNSEIGAGSDDGFIPTAWDVK